MVNGLIVSPSNVEILVNGSGHTISGTGVISGVTLVNNGIVSASAPGQIEIFSNAVTNNGTFVASGLLYLTSPSGFTNYGANTLTGGIYEISGELQFGGADIHTNRATIELSGTGSIRDFSQANGLANFNLNDTGAAFGLLDDANFQAPSGTFENRGTVTIGAGSEFNDAGNEYLQTGGLTQVDGTLAASIVVAAGTVKGSGTIQGSVTNQGGTVSPGDSPGTLTVTGNYTQGAGAQLDIEVGPNAHDLLQVQGTATLSGALYLSALPGFDAPLGTEILILSAGNIVGNFSLVQTIMNFSGGTKGFMEVLSGNNVYAEVVAAPEPGGLFLVGFGLLLAGGARRFSGRKVRSSRQP